MFVNLHLTATLSAENAQATISVDMTPFQTGPKQTVIQKTRYQTVLQIYASVASQTSLHLRIVICRTMPVDL
jgi:hypothetical protein